jgi:lipopolysaccharide transport system permease protein
VVLCRRGRGRVAVGFPAAILPAITVTSHLIHFLIALPILVIALTLGGTLQSNAVLMLPLVIGLQFILTLSLAYFLATFQVIFRDTQYLLGVSLQLLFFLTPIFYDVKAIPERYQTLYQMNPMVHLIEAYRSILIRGDLPGARSLLLLGVLAITLLAGGYFMFRRASYQFVEEL